MRRIIDKNTFKAIWCYSELASIRFKKWYAAPLRLMAARRRNTDFWSLNTHERRLLVRVFDKCKDRRGLARAFSKNDTFQLKTVDIRTLDRSFVVSGLGGKRFSHFRKVAPVFHRDPRKLLHFIHPRDVFDAADHAPPCVIRSKKGRLIIVDGTFRCLWFARDEAKHQKHLDILMPLPRKPIRVKLTDQKESNKARYR